MTESLVRSRYLIKTDRSDDGQDAARKKAEDGAVERARQSGRYVDIAVHSFIPEIPPSRLAVPEDATIDFLKRQVQYRVEVRYHERSRGDLEGAHA